MKLALFHYFSYLTLNLTLKLKPFNVSLKHLNIHYKNKHHLFDELKYIKSVQRILSYDIASWSEITPCNKIDKPLVVYRFTGNVMTSITSLRT